MLTDIYTVVDPWTTLLVPVFVLAALLVGAAMFGMGIIYLRHRRLREKELERERQRKLERKKRRSKR